jgi:hypothetical protein
MLGRVHDRQCRRCRSGAMAGHEDCLLLAHNRENRPGSQGAQHKIAECRRAGEQCRRRRVAPTHLTEDLMRRILLATALLGFVASAHADDTKKPAGTAKGAAVGALAGHEVGSGHAVAGAAVGAAIGHHQSKKAAETRSKS